MIRINQIKLPVTHDTVQLEQKIKKALKLKADTPFQYQIVKKSIDARKKPDLFYVYSVDVETADDQKILKKVNNNNVMSIKVKKYVLPEVINPSRTPVIAGAGPAGLFCAYALMSEGFHPIVTERGKKVEERTADVQKFWETGVLDTASNVQFGEGGAGTFSDGKLNTLVKDPIGRNRFVLETFVKFGAPEHILYENKPHIGTDILADVIKRMREFMTENGVEFLFETCVTGFSTGKNGNLKSIELNHDRQIDTDCLILAIGHSARDTFSLLQEKGLNMQAKSFAVGFRVEHPQSEVNLTQYGDLYADKLPAAPYKVTANLPSGRGVYSFCMCPGGYVVAAASEAGGVVTNGMSLHARDGKNANAAVVVSVDGRDFDNDPAKAVAFQRRLEQAAYRAGGGGYLAPAETVGSFLAGRGALELGAVQPTYPRGVTPCDLGSLLPGELSGALRDGLTAFGRKLAAYRAPDAVLTGLETRTSSPIRLLRGKEDLQCTGLSGLYPCGEGAGYAGGIMTAAVDGVRCAAELMKNWAPAQ